MFYIGTLQALLLTLLITFYNVYLRFVVQAFAIQPLVFTCITLMAGAFVLSFYAGPGRLVKETLRSPATWFYSFILIGAYITDVYVVSYVTATEASFFSRLTIPLSLLLAYMFLKRKPSKVDLLGVGFVLAGMGLLINLQPAELLGPILFVAGLSALLQTSHFFIAETHPEAVVAQETGSIRDRARVVGFVTFVMSSLFMLGAFLLSVLDKVLDLRLAEAIDVIPTVADFAHPATIWAAVLYGLLVLPFARYMKWAASYNIKSENLIIFLAFIPLTTMGFEWLADKATGYTFNATAFEGERGVMLFVVAVLMTLGAGVTAFARIRSATHAARAEGGMMRQIREAMLPQARPVKIQHSTTAMDDYDIVENALAFTEMDIPRAAKLLGIPQSTLKVIHEGKGVFALVADESQRMGRKYRENVASNDALTGLLNRGGFMRLFKTRCEKSHPFTVLYIDLDKFKPVNDTYGHEAGDAVLVEAARRMVAALPKGATTARLGGDEFAVLIPGEGQAETKKLLEELKVAMSAPYKIADETVQVGASIGVANYPEDADNPEDLLKIADKSMYREKGR